MLVEQDQLSIFMGYQGSSSYGFLDAVEGMLCSGSQTAC